MDPHAVPATAAPTTTDRAAIESGRADPAANEPNAANGPTVTRITRRSTRRRAAPIRALAVTLAGAALSLAAVGLAAQAANAGGAAAPVEAGTASTRWVVAETGNEARYRVREQLLRRDLPNDAVGVTTGIEGGITIESDGRVVPEASRFVIDLAGLTSDADRRDGYVRRNTLATDSFPTATFVPTALDGAALPTSAGDDTTFRVRGDLTIRGVTRETTWEVTAHQEGEAVVGRAGTRFPFEAFGLEIPSLGFLLSVDDDIRLEYDFRLVRAED